MTNLLIHLFLRNKQNEHAAVGALAGAVGIGCNILLACIKLAAGILSGSVAIVGDGINNLTDSASSVVTLLGFRMAQRPADKEHPYGHGRYEYVSGVAVAALVMLAGAELVKSSVEKILHPESVPFTPLTLGILLFSIALKLWMAGFNRKLGRRISSKTLEATALDSRNDVIATTAVLICFLVDALFHIHLDGFAGLGVAAFVLWSGIQLCKETISPLLGMEADAETVRQLETLVLSHRRVLGIHDLLIHDYGPGRCFATVHAEMDASETPLEAHDQLDHIEQEALRRLGIHLVIHYDPVDRKDWEQYRILAEESLRELARDASIHDLRVVTYHWQETLTFDIALPYDFPMTDQEITDAMQHRLTATGCPLPVKINVDRQG